MTLALRPRCHRLDVSPTLVHADTNISIVLLLVLGFLFWVMLHTTMCLFGFCYHHWIISRRLIVSDLTRLAVISKWSIFFCILASWTPSRESVFRQLNCSPSRGSGCSFKWHSFPIFIRTRVLTCGPLMLVIFCSQTTFLGRARPLPASSRGSLRTEHCASEKRCLLWFGSS